jgi:hypothetical protein
LVNYLEKLLKGIFFIKISIPNNKKRHRESFKVAVRRKRESHRQTCMC